MKRSSPASARNREPIAAVLAGLLPANGVVFEVASGAGEHIVHFAGRFPHLGWVPSDKDADAIASIQAYVDEARRAAALPGLADPITFDVERDDWPRIGGVSAILCINMVHISPWEATRRLLHGAAVALNRQATAGGESGPLILYGPYRRADTPTAPSNEAFDASLRSRDPAWGLRSVEDVADEAAKSGLVLDRLVEMPANNLVLAFRTAVTPGADRR